MTQYEAPENVQNALSEYTECRNEILSNIEKLNNGDDTGILDIPKIIAEYSLDDKISHLLAREERRLQLLNMDIIEYCRVIGIKNPIF